MKALKLILTIIFLLGVAYIIIFASIFIVNDKSTKFLESELTKDQANFEDIAIDILSDSNITYLSIQGDNENRCEVINYWRKCPGEKWVNETTDSILPKTENVLSKEGISVAKYNALVQFMNQHELKSIIAMRWKSSVNFEASYNGLRYSSLNNTTFKTDNEYLIVNKIDDNWFSYERDVN